MRPLVHVQWAEPAHPSQAARDSCAWIFENLAPARGAVIGVDSWAHLPGATATPWALRGVVSALEPHIVGPACIAFGDPTVGQRLLDAAGRPSLVHEAQRQLRGGPRLRLALPGCPRDAAVPRAWLGRNFVMLAPLAHHDPRAFGRSARPIGGRAALSSLARRSPGKHVGPCTASLLRLAQVCRLEGSTTQMTRWGAQLAREVFASASLVLDATWWAPLGPQGIPVGEAVPVDHCLASPSIGQVDAAESLDRWIAALLGRPPAAGRGQANAAPRVAGNRRAWPQVELPVGPATLHGKGRALAGRAVEAMWSRHGKATAPRRAALTSATPGAFASTWAAEMR